MGIAAQFSRQLGEQVLGGPAQALGLLGAARLHPGTV